MCDIDLGNDPPDVTAREWRQARKQHECCACAEPIRPGERYHLTRQLWEGSWEQWRHCARCRAIVQALWDSGVTWVQYDLACGEIWEDPPEQVARIAFLTREEAQAMVPKMEQRP